MNRTLLAALLCILATAVDASAQENRGISAAELRALASRCAPHVASDTVEAIVRQESALHPYALSVNYPLRSARQLGFPDSDFQLSKQPKTKQQAMRWTRWFIDHGFTVSVGLMQINIEQARALGLHPASLFEPCANIQAGARILEADFAGRRNDLKGLTQAFSLYNSGSVQTGFRNGYAQGVVAKAPAP